IPYSMIEPIRDLLYSNLQGDHMEADKRWVRMLSRQVQSAEVELVANIGSATLTLNQVSGLKIGDVIALDIPAELTAEVDGVPVMECNYGVFNGQYALRVRRMINHSTEDRFPGPDDA
ncbi:MAG: FliM/FliN family flagellar motor switch protein, partial [Betaproteobacteria bacterium]